MLICAISIICLAVVLVLVLVLKDSLRTYFKSLSLSWSLVVRSLSLSLSLGVRSTRSLSLPWSLGVRFLSLSWSLGVRSLLTSLERTSPDLNPVELRTNPSDGNFVFHAVPPRAVRRRHCVGGGAPGTFG